MLAKAKSNAVYGLIRDKSNNRNFYRNFYLQSDHWKFLRREKLNKTPFCEKCKKSYCLDVHHLHYRELYDIGLKDLQTLCRRCHDKEHARKKERKERKELKCKKSFSSTSIVYNDFWAIFNADEPNIYLITWILKEVICELYFLERELQKQPEKVRHLSNRNWNRQLDFDKKYKNIPVEMNNYVSIHY